MCAYDAGYDETDLLPVVVSRISVKKFGDYRFAADSGIGSSVAGSTYSEDSHLSHVRTKSCINALQCMIQLMIYIVKQIRW